MSERQSLKIKRQIVHFGCNYRLKSPSGKRERGWGGIKEKTSELSIHQGQTGMRREGLWAHQVPCTLALPLSALSDQAPALQTRWRQGRPGPAQLGNSPHSSLLLGLGFLRIQWHYLCTTQISRAYCVLELSWEQDGSIYASRALCSVPGESAFGQGSGQA